MVIELLVWKGGDVKVCQERRDSELILERNKEYFMLLYAR